MPRRLFDSRWAQSGAQTDPGSVKTELGWIAEKPAYQFFNWLLGRSDDMLAHIEEQGIPSWHTDTSYLIGALAIGSDADLALWDPAKTVTITNDLLAQGADYTPYEGLKVSGWPVHVMVRGKTIVDEGKLTGEKGFGAYVPRNRSSMMASHKPAD